MRAGKGPGREQRGREVERKEWIWGGMEDLEEEGTEMREDGQWAPKELDNIVPHTLGWFT